MKITAALSWWDEHPEDLEQCVRGMAEIADRVVALDGAYRRYPNATERSPQVQVDVIRDTAAEVGLECVIEQPDRLWAGQCEKRTRLLRLASEDSAWVIVLDADHIVHADREAVRSELAGVPSNEWVVAVTFTTTANPDEPLEKVAATGWHRGMAGQRQRLGAIIRARPGYEVRGNHWRYFAMDDAGREVLVHYGDLGAPGWSLNSYIEVEHRTLFRDEAHILANRAFCNDREMVKRLTGQEDDVPGLPAPAWDYTGVPL